jgi:hypothetical protein
MGRWDKWNEIGKYKWKKRMEEIVGKNGWNGGNRME